VKSRIRLWHRRAEESLSQIRERKNNNENIDLMLKFRPKEHADSNLTRMELVNKCREYVKIKYTVRYSFFSMLHYCVILVIFFSTK
jgi:hypothetical protein